MNLTYEKFDNIDLSDPFFDSLKTDYAEFEGWFGKKSAQSAYIFRNVLGAVDGFLYLKIENGAVDDVTPPLPPVRRVKVGTFKINAHGTKLGERFLKKVFDHAVTQEADEIYVTVFERHNTLIALFEKYGFRRRAVKTTGNGDELVLVKRMFKDATDGMASYPVVQVGQHSVYLLSLYPKWHTRLLPDSILHNEASSIVQDVSHTNSIHKVYLARMSGMENLKPGDVLLIYRTSDGAGSAYYRSVATSICVVEEYRNINSFTSLTEFVDYCRPYSVFTKDELEKFWMTRTYSHIVQFTYNFALPKRVTRGAMINDVGLDANAYWGFMQLSYRQLRAIANIGGLSESLVIN